MAFYRCPSLGNVTLDSKPPRFNKRFVRLLVGFIVTLAGSLLYSLQANTEASSHTATAQVYFSPMGGIAQAIIREIEKAQKEIKVQAYLFTNKDIARSLVAAKRRGVDIEVILDISNRTEKYSAADFIANNKISTYIDAEHAIAHNKLMIIDKEVVITGSFNFTKAAEEKNAENLLVLRSKELAETYLENWNEHRRHSDVFKKNKVSSRYQ